LIPTLRSTPCKAKLLLKIFTGVGNSIAKRCKEIQCKSHDLSDELITVAAEIERFSMLLKAVDVPLISELYSQLSELILRNADFVL
jgi:hypothetical protein